jgi:hypothetical protein
MLSKSSSGRDKIKLLAFTLVVITLSMSDRLLIGELPSNIVPTIIHVGMKKEERAIQVVKRLIETNINDVQNSISITRGKRNSIITFITSTPRNKINETELETILGHNVAVLLGISK